MLETAWNDGSCSGWSEALHWVESSEQWQVSLDSQTFVDYEWAFTMAKICWTYKRAFLDALLVDPLSFVDWTEIGRVEKLCHLRLGKGLSVSFRQSPAPSRPSDCGIKQKKLRRAKGRAEELTHRINRGLLDDVSKQLLWKTLRIADFSPELPNRLREFLDSVERKLEEVAIFQRSANLRQWEERIRFLPQRAKWLKRSGCNRPNIAHTRRAHGASVSTKEVGKNLPHACDLILDYWSEIWQHCPWSEDERCSIRDSLLEHSTAFARRSDCLGDSFDCPGFDAFYQALRRAQGVGGPDGWESFEARCLQKLALKKFGIAWLHGNSMHRCLIHSLR